MIARNGLLRTGEAVKVGGAMKNNLVKLLEIIAVIAMCITLGAMLAWAY